MDRALTIAAAFLGGLAVSLIGVALVFAVALLDNTIEEVCHERPTRIDCVLDPVHSARHAAPVDDGSANAAP